MADVLTLEDQVKAGAHLAAVVLLLCQFTMYSVFAFHISAMISSNVRFVLLLWSRHNAAEWGAM